MNTKYRRLHTWIMIIPKGSYIEANTYEALIPMTARGVVGRVGLVSYLNTANRQCYQEGDLVDSHILQDGERLYV